MCYCVNMLLYIFAWAGVLEAIKFVCLFCLFVKNIKYFVIMGVVQMLQLLKINKFCFNFNFITIEYLLLHNM